MTKHNQFRKISHVESRIQMAIERANLLSDSKKFDKVYVLLNYLQSRDDLKLLQFQNGLTKHRLVQAIMEVLEE